MFGKSRLGMMASLLMVAASGAFGAKEHDRRTEYFTKKGMRFKRTWTRKYPEQSQRQQMRRFRRAQGGPGIYLNEEDRCYLPRPFATLDEFKGHLASILGTGR